MEFDDVSLFKKSIENIVDAQIEKKGITTYIAGIIDDVYSNGDLFDVVIPPDVTSKITGLLNKTGEMLNVGDSVEIATKNGKLSNSWIAIKHGKSKRTWENAFNCFYFANNKGLTSGQNALTGMTSQIPSLQEPPIVYNSSTGEVLIQIEGLYQIKCYAHFNGGLTRSFFSLTINDGGSLAPKSLRSSDIQNMATSGDPAFEGNFIVPLIAGTTIQCQLWVSQDITITGGFDGIIHNGSTYYVPNTNSSGITIAKVGEHPNPNW